MAQVNTVDLSEFQDPKEVDYQAMKDAGIKNLIIRGSVDLRLDHHAAEHIANAKKYGFNWHLYHYFYNDTNEADFAVKAAKSLGLGKDQILFLDMEDKSLPKNWNEQFSIFRKAVGNSFNVGLYCSDSPYNAKFSDSQLKQLGVIRWIASYSYEPKNYDVWQKSGAGSGGFGTYTKDIDRDVDPNNILAISSSKPYVPTSEDKMVRQIILQAGYDTETGIYGLGCSFDNGATFKVYWTIYGQKFYQEDADRLWPFLKDKIGEIKGGSLSVSWSEILNKPDVATQADLKAIELKPGPQGPQGLPGKDGVAPHIDSTTGDWFIGNQDTGTQAQGPAGKNGRDGVDGQPGKDGQNGITPHIDTATGNWFVGSTDTGIKAQGPQGIQGVSGKDGRNGIDTVKTITSGTLSSLSTGKYEIECWPSDTPIQEWGLCDVIVGQHYAKQVFTVTGATDDDQGNVYVRVRDYSGQWHEWRELTAWN